LLLVAQVHLVLEQIVVLRVARVDLVEHLPLRQVALRNLLLLKAVLAEEVDI
jgi:hypothetical protein